MTRRADWRFLRTNARTLRSDPGAWATGKNVASRALHVLLQFVEPSTDERAKCLDVANRTERLRFPAAKRVDEHQIMMLAEFARQLLQLLDLRIEIREIDRRQKLRVIPEDFRSLAPLVHCFHGCFLERFVHRTPRTSIASPDCTPQIVASHFVDGPRCDPAALDDQ